MRRVRLHKHPLLLPIARFFVVLLVALAPWPGLGRAYVAAFNSFGNLWINVPMAGSGFHVSLERFPESDRHHEWSSMLSVTDAVTDGPLHRGAADLRRSGYMQMVILLAAAFAVPLRNRARGAATLAGGLACFAMLGWLPIWMYLAKKQVLHLGFVPFAVLAVAERSLTGAPGMAFALPALVWLIATAYERSLSFKVASLT